MPHPATTIPGPWVTIHYDQRSSLASRIPSIFMIETPDYAATSHYARWRRPDRRASVRLPGALLRRLRTRGPIRALLERLDHWAHRYLLSDVLASDPRLTLTRCSGHLRAVRADEELDPSRVSASNLKIVADLCADAGIEYFVIDAKMEGRCHVGVASSDRLAFIEALAEHLRHRPVYAEAHRTAADPRVYPGLTRDVAPVFARSLHDRIWVYEFHWNQRIDLIYGTRHACAVEFWERTSDGTLRTEHSNPWTTEIPPTEQQPAQREFGGRRFRSLAPFAQPRLEAVDFPVDAVYLWVDGSDPAWQKRRAEALEKVSAKLHGSACAPARFRSHGELRHSMRTLERFAPWIHHVYLVTDDQVPAWLDVDHPDLTLVDHRELFGAVGVAPSFNSHAISSRLHHIAGLSEHFLVINDDVLFGRPVEPERFFLANGNSCFFMSRATLPAGPVRDGDLPHEAARKRARDLVVQDFGSVPTRVMKHTPIPQQKSLLQELERRFPREFERTAGNQFRSTDDIEIPGWLHHYYGYGLRRTLPGTISYEYFNLGQRSALSKMQHLLRRRMVDVFCVNDDISDEVGPEELYATLGSFLARFAPWPSRFELTHGDPSRVR